MANASNSNATRYKGNDIDTDGDGKTDGLENHESAGNPHTESASATDLNNHASNGGAHHSRYSDSEARNACNGRVDADTVDNKHADELGGATWTHYLRQVRNSGTATLSVQHGVNAAEVWFGKSGNQATELRDSSGNTLKRWTNDNNEGGSYTFSSELNVDHIWFDRTHTDPALYGINLKL